MATQTSQAFLEEFYSTAQGGTKEDRKRQTGTIPFKGPPFNSSHSRLPDLVEHSAHGQLCGVVRHFLSFRAKRAERNGEGSYDHERVRVRPQPNGRPILKIRCVKYSDGQKEPS